MAHIFLTTKSTQIVIVSRDVSPFACHLLPAQKQIFDATIADKAAKWKQL
jgi:hypothetical protein